MAFEMVAESVAVIWSSVTKCSSGFPFVIHQQQMESSSTVLISSHSSASTEKYELDARLLTSFLSSQVSMASNSVTTE